MNPVFKAASEALTMGWLMGIMTLLFMTFFSLWVWWAYRPSNREAMAAAAQLPFDEV